MHPQVKLAIERAGELPSNLSPSGLRRHYDRVRIPLQPPRPDVHRARTVTIETRGGAIEGRFYVPTKTEAAKNPLLIYYHGGGWVLGSLERYDTLCRSLALASGWSVLSVDYRLAPEHKFPAAVEDARDSVVWAVNHADELGIDPSNIAVGGDSAGANLSAVMCPLVDENVAYAQLLRDHGVPIDYALFEDMIHPFLSMGGVIEEAASAVRTIGEYLQRLP